MKIRCAILLLLCFLWVSSSRAEGTPQGTLFLCLENGTPSFVTSATDVRCRGTITVINLTIQKPDIPPPPPPLPVPPLTQTWSGSGDFSSQQGKDHWTYEAVTDGQIKPMQWNSERSRWEGEWQYPYIGLKEAQPSSISEAVRTWTSPAVGPIRVTGFVHGLSLTALHCSDGIAASILRDGLSVWSTTVDGDKKSAHFSLPLNVQVGTRISFVLNKGATQYWCDNAAFDADIQFGSDPPPTGKQLTFFGYYATAYPPRSTIADAGAWINAAFRFPWTYPTEEDWRAFRDNGIKMIFWGPTLFVENRNGTAPSGTDYDLAPDWRARWEAFTAQSGIRDHLDQVLAIYLPDEPFHNGIQCGELTDVATAMKATFPTIPLLLIEAAGAGLERLCPIQAMDWIGFDHYSLPAPFTNYYYQHDYHILRDKLLPHQKTVYVMDGFYDRGHQAAGLTPADLGPIAQSCYQMASADPRAVGILTYMWVNAWQPVPLAPLPGSKNLPASVLAIHQRIGKAITKKYLKLTRLRPHRDKD